MNRQKHLHVIGIGGIGVSALARYYQHRGYTVSGSDGAISPLITLLQEEGFQIALNHNAENLPDNTDLVIYSEAIITKPDLPPEAQIYANPELFKAKSLGIRHLSYPEALGEIFNQSKGVAIAGSHGKSTTTAMTTLMLANEYTDNPTLNIPEEGAFSYMPNSPGCTAIIGTQIPQLGNTNFYTEIDTDIFVIEACEYKRSFLQYRPYVTVITNIDLDHLDYYTDLDDYIDAFQTLVDQTEGFVILSANDSNSEKLVIPDEKKILVGEKGIEYFARGEDLEKKEVFFEKKTLSLPLLHLQIPGKHILHDAHLAYTVGRLLGMDESVIVPKLESYKGSWRRLEIIKITKNENIFMSDYGHHPNEIRPTLQALREKYPDKKLFVIFQPHQYSRTRELLQEFGTAFDAVDSLVIPNIYFSRDKKEDVEYMTVERLIYTIQQEKKGDFTLISGEGLDHTADIVRKYDEQNPNSSVILLLGAGDVDMLRFCLE